MIVNTNNGITILCITHVENTSQLTGVKAHNSSNRICRIENQARLIAILHFSIASQLADQTTDDIASNRNESHTPTLADCTIAYTCNSADSTFVLCNQRATADTQILYYALFSDEAE